MLEGRIQSYGVFDALQIAGRRAGGHRLVLNGPDLTVELRFQDGCWCDAVEPDRPEAGALVARLRALGAVDDRAMGRALAASATEGRPVSDVLVTDFELEPARWAEVRGWQAEDRLWATFGWTEGDFRLEPADPDPELECRMPIGEVIATGLQIAESWPRVRRWVPSWTARVERAHGRTRAAADPDAPFDVAAVETSAWPLVRPGRTAGAIADAVPGPRVWTRWVLGQWVARGDLEWAPLAG